MRKSKDKQYCQEIHVIKRNYTVLLQVPFWTYFGTIYKKLNYIYITLYTQKKWSTSALIVNKERYALQGKILHFNKVFTKQYLKHTQVMSYIYCIKYPTCFQTVNASHTPNIIMLGINVYQILVTVNGIKCNNPIWQNRVSIALFLATDATLLKCLLFPKRKI